MLDDRDEIEVRLSKLGPASRAESTVLKCFLEGFGGLGLEKAEQAKAVWAHLTRRSAIDMVQSACYRSLCPQDGPTDDAYADI